MVELSSFQLMSMRKSPDVALITNISPNHLDIHSSMEEYIEAKNTIISHQNAFSRAMFNEDNELSIKAKEFARGEVFTFSRQHPVKKGAYLDKENNIVFSDGKNIQKVINIAEIKLYGLHNVENYMAAISMVWNEVSIENMVAVAKEFGGVPHRFEFIRECRGIKFYNDSIASSPTRTIAGLNSCKDKIILIAGGYDKKIPFDTLAPKILEKVKVLILMGNTAEKIKTAVTSHSDYTNSNIKIIDVDNMEAAVKNAVENAEKGDLIALSPACASFDKYANFELRGNHFKDIVNSL